jgi:hypothetical protein
VGVHRRPAGSEPRLKVGDLRTHVAEYYDSGATGVGFWDVSGAVTDATLWPIISRLGHREEVRALAGQPRPARVTLPITRWDGITYGGRHNPWASG